MTAFSASIVHPMLTSVVHHTFKHAVLQIGCSELAESVFSKEIEPHLKSLSTVLEVNEIAKHRLWHAVLAGEVMAAEFFAEEELAFHVRTQFQGQFVDIRLTYHLDDWHVQAITSVHHRPFHKTPLFAVLVLTGSVIVAGLIGFGIANRHQALTQSAVQSWAAVNGYELVKPASGQPTSGSSSIPPTPAAQAKPAPKKLTFTFKRGMTVHDISSFLAHNNLVKSSYAFDKVLKKAGIDKLVKFGTYTFTSGMSQTDIINVLKHR